MLLLISSTNTTAIHTCCRRIEAEEKALGTATVVFTSTRQEVRTRSELVMCPGVSPHLNSLLSPRFWSSGVCMMGTGSS